VIQPLWKRSAGLWGPAAFVTATVVGGAIQPGYDHRRCHISGLAAHGARSAPVMIPGFISLGLAGLVLPATGPVRPMSRIAGVGTVLAGAFRCSDVRCPEPGRDPAATREDAIHAAVSILTFVVWTALPFVDARASKSTRARIGGTLLGIATAAGFAGAAATARSDDPRKGLAQRFFLATVFARYATTAVRAISRRPIQRAVMSGTSAT
jgi:Protein of unknown function (DUF998)